MRILKAKAYSELGKLKNFERVEQVILEEDKTLTIIIDYDWDKIVEKLMELDTKLKEITK